MEEKNIQNVNSGDAQPRAIEIGKLLKVLFEKRRLIFRTCFIVAILSSAFIICIPRTYTTVTRVAPEVESAGGAGAISSLASSFGFDLGDAAASSDAISPLLYPDLMIDNAFVSQLFGIKVKSSDGTINTTYYDYLANYQKLPWWGSMIDAIKKIIPSSEEDVIKTGNGNEFNPYILNKKQFKIMEGIRSDITIEYDKITSVISITATSQDKYISKQIADSVRSHLQKFITVYRTNKARTDVAYYQNLADKSFKDYEEARLKYAHFSDANTDVSLPSVRGRMEEMENDMQMKYNSYTALVVQLQAAQSKLQEKTPAFTLLQGAEVPIKPTGPKRMIFVAAMTILAFIGSCLWSARDILFTKQD